MADPDEFMDDNEEIREIEVNIEPLKDRLEALGISFSEFQEALPIALERYHASVESAENLDAIPGIEEAMLDIRDMSLRLGDIAAITASGSVLDESAE